MMRMVFAASLYRIAKDREGEVTVTFKVPKSHAGVAMAIPEEKALRLTIEEVGGEREGSDD